MAPTPRTLAIDARPRGPRGPLANERVLGRTVLDHLLDLASIVSHKTEPIAVHVLADIEGVETTRHDIVLSELSPASNSVVLRTDRLYDRSRLKRALRSGADPESAVIWRLDTPELLQSANDELRRRQTYQPLGRYWALDPARQLARLLAPTRVRPNAITLAAAGSMAFAATLVAFAPTTLAVNLATATALALGLVLDTADGHLARLQGTASAFGRWLDAWLDEICDMALHAAIAWSAFERSGHAGWLVVGMFYGMGKYVFLVGTTEPDGEADKETDALISDRSILRDAIRMAGHADIRWHLWIVLAALGRLDAALIAYAAYYLARSVLSAMRKAVRVA